MELESEIRQIVCDLGIHVASKKKVCKQYCELKKLNKLSSTEKKEIHQIIACIVEELIANPDSSIVKQGKDEGNNSSPQSGQELCKKKSLYFQMCDPPTDDLKENCGINSSDVDKIINDKNFACVVERKHNEDVMKKDSPAKIAKKKRLKRIKSQDILNSILDSDDNPESNFSSACSTPVKTPNNGLTLDESPLVKSKLVSRRKRVVDDSEDSESERENIVKDSSLVKNKPASKRRRILNDSGSDSDSQDDSTSITDSKHCDVNKKVEDDSDSDCQDYIDRKEHEDSSDTNTNIRCSKNNVKLESDAESDSSKSSNQSSQRRKVVVKNCKIVVKDCLEKNSLKLKLPKKQKRNEKLHAVGRKKFIPGCKRKRGLLSYEDLDSDELTSEDNNNNMSANKLRKKVSKKSETMSSSDSSSDGSDSDVKSSHEKGKSPSHVSSSNRNILNNHKTDGSRIKRKRMLLSDDSDSNESGSSTEKAVSQNLKTLNNNIDIDSKQEEQMNKKSLEIIPSDLSSVDSDVESSPGTEPSSLPSHSPPKLSSVSNKSRKEKKTTKQDPDKVQSKKPESKELKSLRAICRHIGMILRNTMELQGCDTDKEKVRRIKKLLHEKGMKGRPSMKSAEQFNLERELKELGAVQGGKGLSSPSKGSRKRACRGGDFFSAKNPPSAITSPETHDDFSHMKDIFCADDSSD